MIVEPVNPIKIFFSYSHKDRSLHDELAKHLEVLKRSEQVAIWHDREIQPGVEWKREIDTHLNTSNIILLLISPNFIRSDYCYGVEMRRALDRHKVGEARVIPIILRPVNWKDTPVGELQALPTEGKPITTWRNRDEAFEDVIRGIREVLGSFPGESPLIDTEKSSNEIFMTNSQDSEPSLTNSVKSVDRAKKDTADHVPIHNDQYYKGQHSHIGRNLRSLADQIERCDWRSASQLRSLSDAVDGNPGADTWTASDVYKLIDPAIVTERFRDMPIKRAAAENLLEPMRNVLILAPLIVTWYAISQATQAYNQLLATYPEGARQPFLYLWQQGFGGMLPLWLTIGSVGFIDFLLLCVVAILTYLVHALSNAEINKRELDVQKLHEDIIRILKDASLYLRSKEKPSLRQEDS